MPPACAPPTTPGLALAVTSRDRLLHVATDGLANIDAKTPVTPATLFEIGSISKSFTSIALLQLRDEGAFDTQAPITKYLPTPTRTSATRRSATRSRRSRRSRIT